MNIQHGYYSTAAGGSYLHWRSHTKIADSSPWYKVARSGVATVVHQYYSTTPKQIVRSSCNYHDDHHRQHYYRSTSQ